MIDEGYIKFHCNWIKSNLTEKTSITNLNYWRSKLYNQNLIGAYSDGIGYGNLSMRLVNNVFMITGSTTGNFKTLTDKHFAKVISYDILNNALTCEGQIKASSESLTHAVFYESIPNANAVVHIHNNALWKSLINNVPTSSPHIAYGTPEMALEIKRLLESSSLKEDKILVMAGHQDGLFTFGNNLEEAVNKALSLTIKK